MYEPLLFIHSWLRWLVLAAALLIPCAFASSALRRQPWSTRDESFVWAFNQLFLYQVAFGITLWVAASPIVHAAIRNPSLILSDPGLTFWTLRHPLTMIGALSVLHIGRWRARRVATERLHWVYVATFVTILLCICSAIPWPFLSYGRSLFRGF